MPTTVKLLLRTASVLLDEHGDPVLTGRGYVTHVQPTRDEIDLNRLSPRARAMAEAIATGDGQFGGEIWLESDQPIRDLIPEWATWYSPERAALPQRRPWSAWDRYKADDPTDPHDWLERQAAKIPAGWHLIGHPPSAAQPVGQTISSSPEQQRLMTLPQVLATLARRGRHIQPSTWRAYVARGQAPKPADRTGREPLWDSADIDRITKEPAMSTATYTRIRDEDPNSWGDDAITLTQRGNEVSEQAHVDGIDSTDQSGFSSQEEAADHIRERGIDLEADGYTHA